MPHPLRSFAPLVFALALAAQGLEPGSTGPATADPAVSRPDGAPQVVRLFQDLAFADFSVKTFTYPGPPAPGPWAKVVLVGEFSVSPGIQYDRTCQVTLGRVNVFHGTTPEPEPGQGRTWRVERDLTEYAALLASRQRGEAILGNKVDAQYTGIITGSVRLEFHPAGPGQPAPRVPDVVLPMRSEGGGALALGDGEAALSATFDLPSNIERAYLDVLTQGQAEDEFWYLSSPDPVDEDGAQDGRRGLPWREGELSLDGRLAGLAPVFPWIFTGGHDPDLWSPIPGLQALCFRPWRMDLTPFAGRLNDGAPHTLALRVAGTRSVFLADGTLFLYLDAGSVRVPGELTENTLVAARPVIKEEPGPGGPGATRTVAVASRRRFEQAGFVLTSHGRVETRIEQDGTFSSVQTFEDRPGCRGQVLTQDTRLRLVTVRGGSPVETCFHYPLAFSSRQTALAGGSGTLAVAVDQGHEVRLGGVTVRNRMASSVTRTLDASGRALGPPERQSTQTWSRDGACPASVRLTSEGGVLRSVARGSP